MKEVLGISVVACFAILFTVLTVLLSPSITGDFTHSGTYLQYSPSEACMALPVPCYFSRYMSSVAVAAPFNMPMVECICTDGTTRYAALTVPVVGLAQS